MHIINLFKRLGVGGWGLFKIDLIYPQRSLQQLLSFTILVPYGFAPSLPPLGFTKNKYKNQVGGPIVQSVGAPLENDLTGLTIENDSASVVSEITEGSKASTGAPSGAPFTGGPNISKASSKTKTGKNYSFLILFDLF